MSLLAQLVFSWDRPLQLWGLVRSLLDNTDLRPEQIQCLCKFSGEGYQELYHIVGRELGCQIIYQGDKNLWGFILEQTRGSEFVSLAVDDMTFFGKASYSEAIKTMQDEPEICLWSWRIGVDLEPSNMLLLHGKHWTVPHATAPMPYSYIFHCDGSLYRKKDFEYWMHLIPKQQRAKFNLNYIEAHLARIRTSAGRNLGSLHAGPLVQACITWRVNKVSGPYGSSYCEVVQTKPAYLRGVFEAGGRLDYTPLYGRTDWLRKLNVNFPSFTHVAPTREAANLFATLIGT